MIRNLKKKPKETKRNLKEIHHYMFYKQKKEEMNCFTDNV